MQKPQNKKTYRLLKHQADFINDNLPNGTVGLVGGFRAGKTYAAVHKAVKLAFLNKGKHGALMEPIQSMVRTVLIPVIEKVFKQDLGWTEGKEYTYVKSNPESIVIHFPEGDSRIYLNGAENYGRLTGRTLSWFGIDEIDRCSSKEIAIEAFKECTSRLTHGSRHGFVTSTPSGFAFLHHHFVENGVDPQGNVRTDRKLYKAKTHDNPYVPLAYIQTIRTNYTPKEAEAYLNGDFVNLLSGNVYHAFDRAANATTKTLQDFPNHILHVGMDFNVGSMSAVISVIDQGVVYTLDEITGEANTESLIRRLRTQYSHWAQRQGGVIIYPDSSGKSASANASLSSITMLKQAGFECKYNGNNPSILKERVPAMNAIFRSQQYVNGQYQPLHRCFVNLVKCPVLVKGLEQQGFDPQTGKPDKTSGLDHCLDAMGYFVHMKFPVADHLGRVRVA